MAGRHLAVYCSHCGKPRQGVASLTTKDGEFPLCHPDEGMDCYRLVTVYQHRLVDCPCALVPRARAHRDWFEPATQPEGEGDGDVPLLPF